MRKNCTSVGFSRDFATCWQCAHRCQLSIIPHDSVLGFSRARLAAWTLSSAAFRSSHASVATCSESEWPEQKNVFLTAASTWRDKLCLHTCPTSHHRLDFTEVIEWERHKSRDNQGAAWNIGKNTKRAAFMRLGEYHVILWSCGLSSSCRSESDELRTGKVTRSF